MQDNDFKNVLNSRIAETERILKANLPEENKYSKKGQRSRWEEECEQQPVSRGSKADA